ncbi:rhomboid family intramembrane serine protease [Nonlabens tegetincola]|uniref:rhomboid family intramembrane serine protease n=1 Tax=Nonlabens tegetincola TaxID=323273 RepID=UPI0030C868E8
MQDKEYFKFDGITFLPAVLFVLLIWLVYYVEVTFHIRFNKMGIYPKSIAGLKGIFTSPFIHGSLQHLWSNTVPSFILLVLLNYFYRKQFWFVFIMGLLSTGILTWLIASNGYHIGASGIIYLLVSFLFFKGLLVKHYRLVSLSFLIAFFYGSLIWYMLPIKEGMSWEGHLSGFITGLVIALFTKNKMPEKRKFQWEHRNYDSSKDPFMQQFDDEGNFFEIPSEEEE